MIAIAVIAGPTASGKSRLALDLAERLPVEIVSADSQQVYRGLDAGTAKPTPAERAAVPHHLLDLVETGEGMDAARWTRLAEKVIEEISGRGKLPLVVGGTGLYLRALLHGVVDAPGRDPALRARLEAEAEREGRAALHDRLAAIDPGAAVRIKPNDLVRVVRALEMAEGGQTQSERFAAHGFAEERYRARILALDLPRSELHRRIEARVVSMFQGGLLDEARALAARFGAPLPAKLPIGYAEAVACVQGRLDLARAVEEVQVATRRYARRQVIWLRKERGVEWLRPPFDPDRLAESIRPLLRPG